MKSLAVFDLDGTLLPFDSFRRLIARQALRNMRLQMAIASRFFCITQPGEFAERAHHLLRPYLRDEAFKQAWIDELVSFVDEDILKSVRYWQESGATVVLLSASPQEYVGPLGSKLGFDQAFGSYWAGEAYIHMSGAAKTMMISKWFPQSQWKWSYSVGDSDSDLDLLSHFQSHKRIFRD